MTIRELTAEQKRREQELRQFQSIERKLAAQPKVTRGRSVPYWQTGASTMESKFKFERDKTGMPIMVREKVRGGLGGIYDIISDPQEIMQEAEKLKKMGIKGPSKTTSDIMKKGEQISKAIQMEREILKAHGPAGFVTSLQLGTIDSLIKTVAGVPRGAEIVMQKPEALIPGAVIAGHQATVGTAVALKEDPAQTINDIVMISAIMGTPGRAYRGARSLTKGKIAAEAIIEPEVLAGTKRFPVTGKAGVSAETALGKFKTSEYKISTAVKKGKVEPPLTAKALGKSKKFISEVDKIDKAFSAWHGTPSGFGKTTTARVGTSSTPGLHMAPSLSPHFMEIGGEVRLFGIRKSARPTALNIEVEAFKRIPNTSRQTWQSMNKYLNEVVDVSGSEGIAYITSKYEVLGKKGSVEWEVVLPPGTPIKRIASKLETTYKGRTVSVEQYKAVFVENVSKDINTLTTLEKLYSERAGKRAIISQYEVSAAGISSISRGAVSRVSVPKSMVSTISDISNIKSIISRPDYVSSETISRYVPPKPKSYRPPPSYQPPPPSYRPPPSYDTTNYFFRVSEYINDIERIIISPPPIIPKPLITPPQPKIIPIKVKAKVKGKKKKHKVKKGLKEAFVRNPVPSIRAFMGIS